MKDETKNKIREHLEAINNLLAEPSESVEPTGTALKDITQGAKFTYQGIEFVKLGEEQGGVLCVTSTLWKNDIKFGEDANYKKSNIKKLLEKEFWNNKQDSNILDYTMDLTADNGEDVLGEYTAKVGLLSCGLIRKYFKVIPKYNDWWWTCTPWCYSAYACLVRHVDTSGVLDYNYASNACGVVPACILDGQTLISCDSN